MKILCCGWVLGMVLAGVAGVAVAADPPIDSSLWPPLQWRSIGPFRGGRVLAVAGVPGEPDHYYFGAVNGGVWETQNAGRTWVPIFDATEVGSIGALAIAPSDSKIIYVGTGEADMRSDIAQGEGMFKSTDAGRSWRRIGLADSRLIGRILVDPHNADNVLVASLGRPYGPNETRGVFHSTDGGASWRRTLIKDQDTGAIDLAAEPGQPNVVYAALWQTRRPPWNVYPPSSGPGGGLYKSVDGGETWVPLEGRGLPVAPGRIGIAIAPTLPNRVYTLIDAKAGGLYRSDDRGDHWERVSDDARLWGRGWYFGGVTVDPKNPAVVYVCNTAMYRSEDGGKTFLPVKGAPGGDDYHQLWIDSVNPDRQILGVDQGAVVTHDGGASWSSWYNQPTGQFYHVATDNRFPYWVYGAQQDSGAAGVPSRTDNIDGINITQFRETAAGGESDNIAPDPDDPQILFGGRVDRVDLRTGQKQSVDPTLGYPGLYRATWTLPLVFATSGQHALYFGNQRVFRSADRGLHWEPISPDLSRERLDVPSNLDAATIADTEQNDVRRGVVYAIGISPLNERVIWAGTDDGLVWRTHDGGVHWQDVTPRNLAAWSKIASIEPSHFDVDTAYIAVDRHRLDDPHPYIYRTHDGGVLWKLVVEGLALTGEGNATAINSANVVREDIVKHGLLFSGTEHGVWVSLDDGDHWQTLQQDMPRSSVRDLVVHGSDLVIATHGRGFWIMDDMSALRFLGGRASSTMRLLPPATAYRVRPTGFLGSPMPRDEPTALNPLPGAYLDYVLSVAPNSEVRLTIADVAGRTVRTFSSADQLLRPDLAKLRVAPSWIKMPPLLPSSPGAHRFVWDLHFAPRSALVPKESFGDEQEDGVWAPPGHYWIELKAGGRTYRQPLTITADPRVHLSAAAYARQFALAREVEAARVQIATALAEASPMRLAADQRLNTIVDFAPEKASADFTGAAPQSVSGLRYLADVFHRLAAAVDGADTDPSTDVRASFAKHRALLDATLAQWARIKASGSTRAQ